MGNSGLSRGILTKLSVDTREVDSAARDGEGYGKAAGFKYRKLTATDSYKKPHNIFTHLGILWLFIATLGFRRC